MRAVEGPTLPWQRRAAERSVLRCEKCGACFDLPEAGLPAWNEKPEERERNLKLAGLRARYTVAQREEARWRNRSALAARGGELSLADEARRMAVRFENEAHALRLEIERLGGELPAAPPRDPAEQKIDDELAALREKAAQKKAAQESAEVKPDAPAETDASTAKDAPAETAPVEPAPTGDAVDDELAALKRKVGRRDPPKPAEPTPPSEGTTPPAEDDELAALKRKLKKSN